MNVRIYMKIVNKKLNTFEGFSMYRDNRISDQDNWDETILHCKM